MSTIVHIKGAGPGYAPGPGVTHHHTLCRRVPLDPSVPVVIVSRAEFRNRVQQPGFRLCPTCKAVRGRDPRAEPRSGDELGWEGGVWFVSDVDDTHVYFEVMDGTVMDEPVPMTLLEYRRKFDRAEVLGLGLL